MPYTIDPDPEGLTLAHASSSSSSSDDSGQDEAQLAPNDNNHVPFFGALEPVYEQIRYVYKFCTNEKRLEQLRHISDTNIWNRLRTIYLNFYVFFITKAIQDDKSFSSLNKGLAILNASMDILRFTKEDIKINAQKLDLRSQEELIETINKLYAKTKQYNEIEEQYNKIEEAQEKEERVWHELCAAKQRLNKKAGTKALIDCLKLQLNYLHILHILAKGTIPRFVELDELILKSLRSLSPNAAVDEETFSVIQQALLFNIQNYAVLLHDERVQESLHQYLLCLTNQFLLKSLPRELVKHILNFSILWVKPSKNAPQYYEAASKFYEAARALPDWSEADDEPLNVINGTLNMKKTSADLLANLALLHQQLNPNPKKLDKDFLNRTVRMFIEHAKQMHLFRPVEQLIRQFSGTMKKAISFIDAELLAVLNTQMHDTMNLLHEQQQSQPNASQELVIELITPLSDLISNLIANRDKPLEATTSKSEQFAHRGKRKQSRRGAASSVPPPNSMSARPSQKLEVPRVSKDSEHLAFTQEQKWMTPEIRNIIRNIYVFCSSSKLLGQLSALPDSDASKRQTLQDIYLNCYKIISLGGNNNAFLPQFEKALAELQIEAVDVDEFTLMSPEHLISRIHQTSDWILDYQEADIKTKIMNAETGRNTMPSNAAIITCLEAQLEYSRMLYVRSKETQESFIALDALVFESLNLLPQNKMDEHSSTLIQAALVFNIERYSFYLSQEGAIAQMARPNLHAYLLQLNQLFFLKKPSNELIMRFLNLFIMKMYPLENESQYFDELAEFHSKAIKLQGWNKQNLEELNMLQNKLNFQTISVALKHHLEPLISQLNSSTPNPDVDLLNNTIKLFIEYLALMHIISPLDVILERFLDVMSRSSGFVETSALGSLSKALKKTISLLNKMQPQQFETTLAKIKPFLVLIVNAQSQAMQKTAASSSVLVASMPSNAARTVHEKQPKERVQGKTKKNQSKRKKTKTPLKTQKNKNKAQRVASTHSEMGLLKAEQPAVSLEQESTVVGSVSPLVPELNTPEHAVLSFEQESVVAEPVLPLVSELNTSEHAVLSFEQESVVAEPVLPLVSELNTSEHTVLSFEQESVVAEPEPSLTQMPAKSSSVVIRNGFFAPSPTQLFVQELKEKASALNVLCKHLFSLRKQIENLFDHYTEESYLFALKRSATPGLTTLLAQNLYILKQSIDVLQFTEQTISTNYCAYYNECSDWIFKKTNQLLGLSSITPGAEFLIDASWLSLYERAFTLAQYSQAGVDKKDLLLLFMIEEDVGLLCKNPALLFCVLRMQVHYHIKLAESLTDFLKNEGRNLLVKAMEHHEPVIMNAVWSGFAERNALAFYQQLRALNYFDILFPNAAKWLEQNSESVVEEALTRTNNLPPEDRDRIYVFNQLFLATSTYHQEKSELPVRCGPR